MTDPSHDTIMVHLMDIKAKQAEQGAKQNAIHEDVGELKNHVKTQNGRISLLERKYWMLAGGFGAVLLAMKLMGAM